MSDIAKRFTYHPPRDGQPAVYEEIRATARLLAERIDGLVPDCDERREALIRVEEAVMWANAGIARHG